MQLKPQSCNIYFIIGFIFLVTVTDAVSEQKQDEIIVLGGDSALLNSFDNTHNKHKIQSKHRNLLSKYYTYQEQESLLELVKLNELYDTLNAIESEIDELGIDEYNTHQESDDYYGFDYDYYEMATGTSSVSATPKRKCLAFSGGGIRAALGTYIAMRQIQNLGKLDDVKCVSLISGGSWGFTMWLYEDTEGSADEEIKKLFKKPGYKWGPHTPNNVKKRTVFGSGKGAYWHAWSDGIKEQILRFTTLKSDKKSQIEFSKIRTQIDAKFPKQDVTVYYMVSKLKLKHRRGTEKTFDDYCWFKSSPKKNTIHTEVFECNNQAETYPVINTRILTKRSGKKPEDGVTKVRLLDVLNYCSSAWAHEILGSLLPRCYTLKLCICEIKKQKCTKCIGEPLRLIDSGAAFNIPLIPYMVNDEYKKDENIEIWAFDFSLYSGGPLGWGNLNEIRKLPKAMKKAGKFKTLSKSMQKWKPNKSKKGRKAKYTFEFNDRIIKFRPFHGSEGRKPWTFQKKYPTNDGMDAKRYTKQEYLNFEKEWGACVKKTLEGF